MRFLFVILLTFCTFLSLTSKVSLAVNGRTDQVVPDGAYAGSPDQKTIQMCYKDGGSDYCSKYTYSNGSWCYLIPGPLTNTLCAHVIPGAYWVRDAKYDAEKGSSLQICCSSANVLWIDERCVTVNERYPSGLFYMGGQFTAARVQLYNFSYASSGAKDAYHSDNDNYYINGAGYVYQLYNNDCPYDGSDDQCTIPTSIIKINPASSRPYGIDDNCYMVRDFLKSGCPDGNGCSCEADKDGNAVCDSNFLPIDQSTKKSSSAMNCYTCNANSRLAYSQCKQNVEHRNGEAIELYTNGTPKERQMMASIYGKGAYICGFVGIYSPYRAGCAKIPFNVPPRPFPRIAKADNSLNIINSPAAQLFRPLARVRPFRDTVVVRGTVAGDRCQSGPAEISELDRGTFFKPKMIVQFGANERIFVFSIKGNSGDMKDTYGPTEYDVSSTQQTINSPWNTDVPTILDYIAYDVATCEIIRPSDAAKVAICTRLEYNLKEERGYYVAYQAPPESVTGANSCSQLEVGNHLIQIGSVARPQLNYSYDKNGSPVMPISIDISPNSGQQKNSIINMVTISPNNVPLTIPGYHNDIVAMFADVVARYYDASAVVLKDQSCAMLFNHKVCIVRDQCDLLRDPNALGTCSGKNCAIDSLKKACQAETFCPLDATDKESCYNQLYSDTPLTLDKDLQYYQRNVKWRDISCISQGFSLQSSNVTIDTSGNVKGDVSKINPRDFVLSYVSDNDSSIPQRDRKAFRSSDYENEDRTDNFVTIPVGILAQSQDALIRYIKNIPHDSGKSVYEYYLGSNCDSQCAINNMQLRHRTPRELGLCVSNNSNNDWYDIPSGSKYDLYIPYKCQFLEITLQGGGGGGHYAYPANSVLGFFNPSYYTSYNAVGSSAAYIAGIFDARSVNTDYIRLNVGVGGKKFAQCQWSEIENGGYIGATASMLTDVTEQRIHAVAGAGLSNANVCGGNRQMPGGEAQINDAFGFKLQYKDQNDIYGDGSFFADAWSGSTSWIGRGSGIFPGIKNHLGNGPDCRQNPSYWTNNPFAGSGGCMQDNGIGVGGDGSADVKGARVSLDASGKPRLDGHNKILQAGGIYDRDCRPMCPAVNVQLKLNNKNVVCEYGGVVYNFKDNTKTSGSKYDMQVPASMGALPSKCINEDGTVIFPDRSHFITRCSQGIVTDENRFYGMCSTDTSYSGYITNMMTNKQNFFSGSGIYCDGGGCPAAEVKDPIYDPSLLRKSLFLRKCLDVGFWSQAVGGNDYSDKVITVGSNKLPYMCPSINPDVVSYESSWSWNANWAQTPANSTATSSTCAAGYIPHLVGDVFTRRCGVNGIWESSGSTNPCLFTCKTVEHKDKFIGWDSPTNYSNPVSPAHCLSMPTRVISMGQSVTKDVKYVFAPGKSGQDFQRRCNMPAVNAPVTYINVGSSVFDPKQMPSWDSIPDGALCIPPSFSGQCVDSRHVCYDSGTTGDFVRGWCYNDYVYTTNSFITNPPSMLVTPQGNVVDAGTTKVNVPIKAKSDYFIFDKSKNANSLVFGPYNSTAILSVNNVVFDEHFNSANMAYPNTTSGESYWRTIILLSAVPYPLKNVTDNQIATNIMRAIQYDNVAIAESCTLTDSSVNATAIFSLLQSQHDCSYVCFDEHSNSLYRYSCDLISAIDANSACIPVCHSNIRTIYYNKAQGFSYNQPQQGSDFVSMSVYNDDQCLGRGMPKAVLSLRNNNGSNNRVGQYCNKVVFSYVNPVGADETVALDAQNGIFAGQWNSSVKACSVPANCSVPGLNLTVNHGYDAWVAVFDNGSSVPSNRRFSTYQGGTDIPCDINSSMFQQRISASNGFLIQLYCYNGYLYQIDRSDPLNYLMAGPSTCGMRSIQDIDHIRNLLNYTSETVKKITGSSYITPQVDYGANRLSYYDSLPSLDKKPK